MTVRFCVKLTLPQGEVVELKFIWCKRSESNLFRKFGIIITESFRRLNCRKKLVVRRDLMLNRGRIHGQVTISSESLCEKVAQPLALNELFPIQVRIRTLAYEGPLKIINLILKWVSRVPSFPPNFILTLEFCIIT